MGFRLRLVLAPLYETVNCVFRDFLKAEVRVTSGRRRELEVGSDEDFGGHRPAAHTGECMFCELEPGYHL